MRATLRNSALGILASLLVGGAALFALLSRLPAAQAVLDATPCPGNVCTGSITVGGQQVNYSYTEHIAANGEFRIRFNGGAYATNQLVSFILFDMPAFTSTGYLANPTNGAAAMTNFQVNPGLTAYERRALSGCASCIFDHVMSVNYAALQPGAYAFSFTVVQHGATGGLVSLPFYVHTGAPTNGNEATVWTGAGVPTGMDYPCADNIDNDLDFRSDCADSQCSGFVGQSSTGALCQASETTCSDGFDNDADGLPDCRDSSCNGLDGLAGPGVALCQYGNETGAGTCADGFDNDADGISDCADNTFNATAGGNANTICWKKAAFGCPAVEQCGTGIDDDKDQTYSDNWDNEPLTGANCFDYDCAGNAACPASENKTAGGTVTDAQCFDGLDNDLDHLFDCADPDCAAVINPNDITQVCAVKEFDIGLRYQYCGNGFNDDGDAATDCADSDCARQFGSCGPCPSREDFTWDSCADNRDNDTDGPMNCADTDCANDLGSAGTMAGGSAAYCSAAENTNTLCSDGFDNDNDGLIDCDDGQCAGHVGANGAVCQPAGESVCGDGKDNDGDSRIDCADPNCAGIGSCAANNWTQAPSCTVVPLYSGPSAFTGSGPTVTAVAALTSHVSSTHTLRFIGSASYSSVTIVVGDNTVAASYYPYANAATCVLHDTASGTTSSRFKFTVADNHAVQVYNTVAVNSGFDITLRCDTPATPATVRYYPVSLAALRTPGDVQEYGDLTFSTTLYEHTPPTVSTVEMEGVIGSVVSVPYGGAIASQSRRLRGVPNDPGTGVNTSGICRCQVEVNGGTPLQTGADCITAGTTYTSDAAVAVRALAEDGAGNVGAYSAIRNYTVNVTPAMNTALQLFPSSPFFRAGAMQAVVNTSFVTGGSDFFVPSCKVYVRNEIGAIVNGPGPTATFAGIAAGNLMLCVSSVTLPSMADGRYTLTVIGTDNDGDSAETNRRALFMCNTVPQPGDPEPTNGCQYADFDGDGAAEGLYTTVYSSEPKACDNCVGLANASQADTNANGVGDACEPTKEYGRCEIDTEIVCKYDSDDAGHGCPNGALCCPGPSVKDDPLTGSPKNPQQCRSPWGLCTLGGEFCFEDEDCPGGQGLCQDGATACYRDDDCGGVSGTPACTGADRCENLLFPWLQTTYGNVYSGKRITAPDLPPANQYNATFCITAKDVIVNFVSEGRGNCSAATDASSSYTLPSSGNAYSTVLGRVDVAGLRAGKYGTVVTVPAAQLDATINSYAGRMGGRVIRVVGDASLGAHVYQNDPTDGSGTIFIDGGNLTVTGDQTYDTSSVTALSRLASLGIIVLDDGSGTRGNLSVNRAVTAMVGATYLGGQNGLATVAAPDTESDTQLTWYGLVVARQFRLDRAFGSLTEGAERFIYDGRAVVNPPPGFADVTRALPKIGETQ